MNADQNKPVPKYGVAASFQNKFNLRTKILDFRGCYSSRILILRGGNLMSTGDFPESLSQGILVGVILLGRLGVDPEFATPLGPGAIALATGDF